MTKSVLVHGWYGHGNLGDEAFQESIEGLWPEASFVFWDEVVAKEVNEGFDALMIGGGSFLDQPCPGLKDVKVPIAYVGVGIGQSVHPDHLAGLDRAEAIVLRDVASAARLPVRRSASVAADLFLARPAETSPAWSGSGSRKVSILLSEHFAPRGVVPEWYAGGWQAHIRELAQFCDEMVESGNEIEFLPMCGEPEWDDSRAAAMVISRMVRAGECLWYHRERITEREMLEAIAGSRLVVTQRLHGAIFSTSIGCPFLAVCGHDKMRDFCADVGWPHSVELYASSAKAIRQEASAAGLSNLSVLKNYAKGARERWRGASDTVRERLSLYPEGTA